MSTLAVADALVRALFHFLWEGAAIAVALAAVIHVLRPSSARVRYACACLAMLAMLSAFGVTLTRLWPHSSGGNFPVRLTLRNPAADVSSATSAAFAISQAPQRLDWIALLWIVGVVLFAFRTLVSWIAAMRIRRVGICAVSAEWQQKLTALGEELRLSRPVTLLESCLTDTPAVVGLLRPVILMPVGLLAGFPPEQIEFLLLHELAHIRRYDYFVNLLQSLTEDLLFYHPAVWWVSSLIRAERENCCDDVVVAATNNARGLAGVLAALEQNRWAAREAALAANGGNLMHRVRRLVEGRDHLRPAAAPAFAAGLLLAGVALSVAATQHQTTPMALPSTPVVAARPADRIVPPMTPPLARQPKPVLLAQAPPAPPTSAAAPEEPAAIQDTPYQRWLTEEVVYIISDAERQAYRRLQTNEEQQMFIEQFWLRRDPTPGTAANEYREEHYRRIAYTMASFTANGTPGWKTDRGMIYIKFGPPDEREQHPSGGTYQRPIEEGGGTTTTFPFERWRYRYLEGIGTDVNIEFVDTKRNGEYHMTTDPAEKDALLNTPHAGLTLYEQLGLAQKADRFTRTDGTRLGTGRMPLPASMSQFERLQQFQMLQTAPTK